MFKQQSTEASFHIQRIYTKDISFESPKSPQIFQQIWQPEIKLSIDTSSCPLEQNTYEITLQCTTTALIKQQVAFLCQIQQAGIFVIIGLDEEKLAHCLGAYCPTILFPYTRELISNLVCRGTFPQLDLAPINFDALFIENQQQLIKKS